MTEETSLATADSPDSATSAQTIMIETILVGVDGSETAAYAAAWAAEEAVRRGAALTLVHALHLPEASSAILGPMNHAEQRRAEGRKLLDEHAATVRDTHPGLRVETELSDLSPARTLTTLGTSAGLIVTGSRGRGGFTGMLLGSVTRKLAVHTPCPLVVVPTAPAQDAANRIVLGVGHKHSATAARYAFDTARREGAALDVVRAYFANVLYTGMAGVGTMYEGHPESDKLYALAEAKAAIEPIAAEYPDVTVNIAALEGNAVPALIDAARGGHLLVVAAHRRRSPLPVGAGYAVDGVLAHSPVPVAVIPDR